MSCKGIVGQGTVLSLSGDTTIGRLRNLQLPEWITEAVDFSGLNNLNWMCFKPGGLVDPGQFIAELYMDTTIVQPTVRLIQVATITYPIMESGNTKNAILTGSGFITAYGWGNAAIAEPMITPMTFKFDGDGTPPAFTIEEAGP